MSKDGTDATAAAAPIQMARANPKSVAHVHALEARFPFQGKIEQTEMRAMKAEQLQEVAQWLEGACSGWYDTAPPRFSKTAGKQLKMEFMNLYHVNEWLIKPATLCRQCAFVELLTKVEQKPEWYVSHWWGEPVRKFVACVESHVALRGMPRESTFWVCAYANRQHCLDQEVVTDPKETGFFKAMEISTGVLLILNGASHGVSAAMPFTRIWCAFEEYIAVDYFSRGGDEKTAEWKLDERKPLLLDIATPGEMTVHFLTAGITSYDKESEPDDPAYGKARREADFPLDVIRKGLTFHLEHAEATMESDRVHILNWIAGRPLEGVPVDAHENYSKVNKRLRAFFAEVSWRQAVDKEMVDGLKLSNILVADQWRDSLTLDFSNTDKFDDDAMDTFAKGLPRTLKKLTLAFSYCEYITDVGVEALARQLPGSLRTVSICFTGCSQLGDQAVLALLHHRPPNLFAPEHKNAPSVIFKGTGVTKFNTLWDYSAANLDGTQLPVFVPRMPAVVEPQPLPSLPISRQDSEHRNNSSEAIVRCSSSSASRNDEEEKSANSPTASPASRLAKPPQVPRRGPIVVRNPKGTQQRGSSCTGGRRTSSLPLGVVHDRRDHSSSEEEAERKGRQQPFTSMSMSGIIKQDIYEMREQMQSRQSNRGASQPRSGVEPSPARARAGARTGIVGLDSRIRETSRSAPIKGNHAAQILDQLHEATNRADTVSRQWSEKANNLNAKRGLPGYQLSPQSESTSRLAKPRHRSPNPNALPQLPVPNSSGGSRRRATSSTR